MVHAPPYAEMCAYPVRRIYKRGKQKAGLVWIRKYLTAAALALIQRVAHVSERPSSADR